MKTLLIALLLLFLSGLGLSLARALGYIDWSWWLVTLPFWPAGLILLLIGLGLFFWSS